MEILIQRMKIILKIITLLLFKNFFFQGHCFLFQRNWIKFYWNGRKFHLLFVWHVGLCNTKKGLWEPRRTYVQNFAREPMDLFWCSWKRVWLYCLPETHYLRRKSRHKQNYLQFMLPWFQWHWNATFSGLSLC